MSNSILYLKDTIFCNLVVRVYHYTIIAIHKEGAAAFVERTFVYVDWVYPSFAVKMRWRCLNQVLPGSLPPYKFLRILRQSVSFVKPGKIMPGSSSIYVCSFMVACVYTMMKSI